MYWEVDGHNIEVRLRESGTIEILRWDDNAKIVYIPAGLSQTEVIWSLRNLLREKIQLATSVSPSQLYVFGRFWPLILQNRSKSCYVKSGVVYVYDSGRTWSERQLDALKQELLRLKVVELIGKWEEFFNCMLPDPIFRKNANRPFNVYQTKEIISFDRGLDRFPIEQVDYCVFRACSVYLSADPKEIDKAVLQSFPSVKIFEKILKHEYRYYD